MFLQRVVLDGKNAVRVLMRVRIVVKQGFPLYEVAQRAFKRFLFGVVTQNLADTKFSIFEFFSGGLVNLEDVLHLQGRFLVVLRAHDALFYAQNRLLIPRLLT